MRLIDVILENYRNLAGQGLRPAAWKLDRAAIEQLRREAATDGMDVSSINSPPTFLGIPIREVPMGPAQAETVSAQRRWVPCHHKDRQNNRKWDIFDLDNGDAMGAFYASEGEAEREAVLLDLGRRR